MPSPNIYAFVLYTGPDLGDFKALEVAYWEEMKEKTDQDWFLSQTVPLDMARIHIFPKSYDEGFLAAKATVMGCVPCPFSIEMDKGSEHVLTTENLATILANFTAEVHPVPVLS